MPKYYSWIDRLRNSMKQGKLNNFELWDIKAEDIIPQF